MSDAGDRYYQGSGAVPLKGTLLMLVGGLAVVIPSTLVYAWGEFHVSHQKLKAIIAIVFATLIGGAVQALARYGAVRSRLFAGLAGATIGALALYFAWMWFLVIYFQWNLQVLLIDPGDLAKLVVQMVNQGVWQRRGAAISPTELSFLFGGEALLLIGSATLMATRNSEPYCEACGKWTKPSPPMALPATDSDGLTRELENERYEALLRLPQSPATEDAGISAQVYSCPTCEESNYLTLSRVDVKKKGKDLAVTTTEFLTHLIVPHDVAEWVRRQRTAALENTSSGPVSRT